MLKKLILSLFIIGPIIWWAFFSSKEKAPPENLIPKDLTNKIEGINRDNLKKVIRPENQKKEEFKKLTALNFQPSLYLADPKVTAGNCRKFLEETYQDLKKCYKDGCGQRPEEEDGFYDPALTTSMISMKRILEVALLEPEKLEADEWLSLDDLKDMLNVENEDVRKLALKNMMVLHKKDPQVFNEVLRSSEELEGEKAADLMGELMNYVDKDNKAAFMETLNLIAKEKDAYTANKVLRRTQDIRASEAQIKAIGQDLCRFKNDTFNFNGLNYSLKNMATASGHQFSLKDYCR